MAITITSLTDVLAFAIGGTTLLPALQSFCLYASVGIVAIYWFQCTFFVAWMSLDQRRIEQRRNGCLPCYVHDHTRDLFYKVISFVTDCTINYSLVLILDFKFPPNRLNDKKVNS